MTQNRCYQRDSAASDLAASPEGSCVYVGRHRGPEPLAEKTADLRRYLVGLLADGLRARLVESPEINARDLLAQYLTTWHMWQQVEQATGREAATAEHLRHVYTRAEAWVESIGAHPNLWAGDEDYALIDAVNDARQWFGKPIVTWDAP